MKKTNYTFIAILTLICLLLQSSFSNAQPGTLDNTFGTGGQVTTVLGTTDDEANSSAIQSDGKIVLAGLCLNGSDYDFGVTRYSSNGTLDATFGTGGKVITAVGSSDDYGNSVVLQSDGKIVVAGSSKNGTIWNFALVRYASNGSLDAAFGTGGKVTTVLGGIDDEGNSVAIQSDGKIVVAGSSKNGTDNDFALVRYNSNGTLDGTFGTGGKVTTAIGISDDVGYSVKIQSDGKIVLVGSSKNNVNSTLFALARYSSNGTLDATFGTGGKVTTAIGSNNDVAYSVALQSDGKIVVSGYCSLSNTVFAVARYNTNGTLDATFGTGGKVTTAIGTTADINYTTALQSNGKIVSAGFSTSGPNLIFAVVRYTSNGTLDATFGTGGKVTTVIGNGGGDVAKSVMVQTDGKIVVAGTSRNGTNFEFAVVRYNGDPTGINSFDRPNSGIRIYPNPSNGIFNVQCLMNNSNISSIDIFNMLGEVVFHSSINNSLSTIDISSQPSGLYFYQIMEENKNISSGKIIVQ